MEGRKENVPPLPPISLFQLQQAREREQDDVHCQYRTLSPPDCIFLPDNIFCNSCEPFSTLIFYAAVLQHSLLVIDFREEIIFYY